MYSMHASVVVSTYWERTLVVRSGVGYAVVAYCLDLLPSLRFSLKQDLMSHTHTSLCLSRTYSNM